MPTINLSREVKYIVALFCFLMLIGVMMHFSGYTFQVVDQIYCRNFLPWSANTPVLSCQDNRNGDDIFEGDFIAQELKYLSGNPYQQSYSERIMNGYPIRDGYLSDPYTIFQVLLLFLPSTSSINFSALASLFLSFILGYAIARTLEFSIPYAVILGVLSLTPAYVGLFESWNFSLIGYGLLILGMLQFYKYSRIYVFILLALAGASFIILTSVYQLYVYFALNLLLLGICYFDCKDRKKFLILWASVAVLSLSAALIFNFHLERHLSFLSMSNKFRNELSGGELINAKGFALDPLGWVGTDLIIAHRKIFYSLTDPDTFSKIQAFGQGVLSPGAVWLILFFWGIWLLFKKYKGYSSISLFWFFYLTGISHILLVFLIGDPFRSETSIRASLPFFIFGSFAAVYALRRLMAGELEIKGWMRKISLALFSYFFLVTVVFTVASFFRHKFFPEVVYLLVSLFIFGAGWRVLEKYPEKRQIAAGLIIVGLFLPNMARLFLGYGPAVFLPYSSNLYYPSTEFSEVIKNHPEINRVALVRTPEGGMTHSNGPVQMGLSTITGYRNPLFKEYLELYYYHWLIFEGDANPREEFARFRSDRRYIANGAIEAWKFKGSEWKLDEATKRYLRLTGVDALIGSGDLVIQDSEWEKAGGADGLSLWKNKTPAQPFIFATRSRIIPDLYDRLDFIFKNPDWDMDQEAVLSEDVGISGGRGFEAPPNFSILRRTDGYRLVEIEAAEEGILIFPVTYSPYWQAVFKTNSQNMTLRTVKSNYAFLGVVIPSGRGQIELVYNDKPSFINYLVLGLGVIIFLALVIVLKRIYNKTNDYKKPV